MHLDEEDTSSDQSEERYKQIEISHGSTDNQTSIYASTSSLMKRRSVCCDVVYVVLILVVLTLGLLIWCDLLPFLTDFIKTYNLYILKIEIFAGFLVIVSILTVILLVRCWKVPPQHNCCTNGFRYRKLNKRTSSSVLASSFGSSTSLPLGPTNVKQRFVFYSTPKVQQLSEYELSELRRILEMFVNYHDENDWTFRASSYSQNTTSSRLHGGAELKISIKLVLIGNPNSGKTSIFHRILYDTFNENYTTTLGVDLGIVTINLFPRNIQDSLLITLQIYDIASSERFSDFSHFVYKDANAYLLISDVTDSNFTENAALWIRSIQSYVLEPHISLFLNKLDNYTRRVNSLSDYDLYAFPSYHVSAKTGENVLSSLIDVVVKSLLHQTNKYLSNC